MNMNKWTIAVLLSFQAFSVTAVAKEIHGYQIPAYGKRCAFQEKNLAETKTGIKAAAKNDQAVRAEK